MDRKKAQEQIFEQLASVGDALGNRHRLKMISLLSHGEKPVEELAAATGQSMAAASAHLKVLRAARLVASEKRGRHVYCRLASPSVAELWMRLREVGEELAPEVRDAVRTAFDPASAAPLTAPEVMSRIRRGRATLVDLRPEVEYAAGRLPKARNLPFPELNRRAKELPRKDLLVYCRGPYCVMAFEGVERLREMKFSAERLAFSVPEWRAAGLPVEVSSTSGEPS
ncbi:MAG TPA: metalloregulator ArsR/SmtB family transcription factor [Lacipirellula sp.]